MIPSISARSKNIPEGAWPARPLYKRKKTVHTMTRQKKSELLISSPLRQGPRLKMQRALSVFNV